MPRVPRSSRRAALRTGTSTILFALQPRRLLMRRSLSALILILTASFAFAANDVPATAPPAVQRAMKAFDARALAVHDKFLASDLLEGRGPGTRGDDLAMEYIATQFELFGLQPAGDHGTYYQRVPLVGARTIPEKSSISFVK